jgi:hypothetical protein
MGRKTKSNAMLTYKDNFNYFNRRGSMRVSPMKKTIPIWYSQLLLSIHAHFISMTRFVFLFEQNLKTHQGSGLLSTSQKGTNKHQDKDRKIMKISCVRWP